MTSVQDRIAALIAENGPRNPDGSPAPWPVELLDWLRQTELNMRAEVDTRPDIPLGYTYDWLGNVLTFKNRDCYWYEFTRDIHSNPLTYENKDGDWIKYIRDERGVFLDAESGRGTPTMGAEMKHDFHALNQESRKFHEEQADELASKVRVWSELMEEHLSKCDRNMISADACNAGWHILNLHPSREEVVDICHSLFTVLAKNAHIDRNRMAMASLLDVAADFSEE